MALRLSALIALGVAGLAILSFYESRYLGLFPLGEVPPKADAYHMARSGVALLFSFLVAATIQRHRAADCALNWSSMSAEGGAAAIAVLVAAITCAFLLHANPLRFSAGAEEDSLVEWTSALLLLGGSALLARLYLVRRASGQVALPALLLALVLFTIGMEEVSWLQRVIGFATPQEIARANMQEEFNLHNVHTDLSENLYYVGAFGFLILLPFLRDALPALRGTFAWVGDYLPSRWVAAVSAPLSIFNYGMWNVIPMQMTMMLTVLVTTSYALAASARGARGESAIFAKISLAVVAGQAAVLAAGHTLPNIWDPSEYKELFIAIGLFAAAGDLGFRKTSCRVP